MRAADSSVAETGSWIWGGNTGLESREGRVPERESGVFSTNTTVITKNLGL